MLAVKVSASRRPPLLYPFVQALKQSNKKEAPTKNKTNDVLKDKKSWNDGFVSEPYLPEDYYERRRRTGRCHYSFSPGRPTLVLCHNKTVAAQLARELCGFLSKNAVELLSIITTIKYVNPLLKRQEKSSVNDEIDASRHRATHAFLERQDVVVVASVSCIYGLGLPAEYLHASMSVQVGDEVDMNELIAKLENMLYSHLVG